jgi:hypothetical protein
MSFFQIQTVWKAPFLFFTKSMYLKKHSPLTPFIANGIRKLTETGIMNILYKRHVVLEPNCQPLQAKGRPLGMEKFASLFIFYLIFSIVSLIILVIEIVTKASSSLQMQQKTLERDSNLKFKKEAINKSMKHLDNFSNDKEVQLLLFHMKKVINEM